MRLNRTYLFVSAMLACVIALAPAGCSKDEPEKKDPGGGDTTSWAQPVVETEALSDAHAEKVKTLINRGVAYLLSEEMSGGGWGFGESPDPALTAIVLKVLAQHPEFDSTSPVIQRGMEVLKKHVQEDGGIYQPGQGHESYTTSISVMAIAALDDPQYEQIKQDAIAYLKGIQLVPGTTTPDGIEITEGHPMEGGMGYSKKHMRPDLSNTSFMLYAMEEGRVPHDDPAIQRAMAFVSRCQNNPETNPLGWAKEGPGDGGMVYAPAKNPKLHGSMVPESKADTDTGLRSYGSMTYSGFKSLLYATGMNRNDDRVLAAFDWIRSNWTLETNPNMPGKRSRQGLYYYYHAFAKALQAWGEDRIKTMDGEVHNWREELIDTLDEKIRDDGSWVNEASRWMEADPRLVTCYSVLALQESLHK